MLLKYVYNNITKLTLAKCSHGYDITFQCFLIIPRYLQDIRPYFTSKLFSNSKKTCLKFFQLGIISYLTLSLMFAYRRCF